MVKGLDLNNPVIKLCVEGTQAEYPGRPDTAFSLYQQAWDAASTDYEACIAAHDVARCQNKPADELRWNQEALNRANRSQDDRVKDFYPSLYLKMGQSYQRLGQQTEAQKYFDLAAELGAVHPMDDPDPF